jgi:hypothetical protein
MLWSYHVFVVVPPYQGQAFVMDCLAVKTKALWCFRTSETTRPVTRHHIMLCVMDRVTAQSHHVMCDGPGHITVMMKVLHLENFVLV